MNVFEFIITALALAIVAELSILAIDFFLTEGDDE